MKKKSIDVNYRTTVTANGRATVERSLDNGETWTDTRHCDAKSMPLVVAAMYAIDNEAAKRLGVKVTQWMEQRSPV